MSFQDSLFQDFLINKNQPAPLDNSVGDAPFGGPSIGQLFANSITPQRDTNQITSSITENNPEISQKPRRRNYLIDNESQPRIANNLPQFRIDVLNVTIEFEGKSQSKTLFKN